MDKKNLNNADHWTAEKIMEEAKKYQTISSYKRSSSTSIINSMSKKD